MSQEWKHANLEQSKKLVNLNVTLGTERYWDDHKRGCELTDKHKHKNSEVWPAPDVAELGRLLPDMLTIYGNEYYLEYGPVLGEGEQRVTYVPLIHGVPCIKAFKADTEAECRCDMLIWLVENKHLEI